MQYPFSGYCSFSEKKVIYMGQYRKGRLAEELKKEISRIIRTMKDPRLGLVSVIKVDVDADMSSAKIYVSHFGSGDFADTMAALKKGSGYIRSELAKALKTRTVPQLIFVEDHSIEEGFKISEILNDYNKSHPASPDGEEQEQ